ncbi:MAG: hypothetical protein ACM3MF_06080 [Anaerolineae bacterium]
MAARNQTGTLFEEEQRFTQTWLWVLVLTPVVVIGTTAALAPRPRGAEGAAAMGIVAVALGIAVLVFALAKLTTEITAAELHLRYRPFFVNKHIAIGDIARLEIVNYDIWQAGYGIHYSHWGWVYNTSGNEGIHLVLRSGKQMMIGTQRPREFAAALQQAGAGQA